MVTKDQYRKMRPVNADPDGYGYWVGWLEEGGEGAITDKPVQVQFDGSKIKKFRPDQVTLATFAEFLINPNGVGRFSYPAAGITFGVLLGGCVMLAVNDLWSWWMLLALPVIIAGMYGNYKGIMIDPLRWFKERK